ncbi:MAG: hypothetical protein JW939_09625 [Candidatus Thermoplasmatota archaeon]|nr:hypothetical protein [Candidatus Thermoplasmatota archaeon]
MEIKKVEEIPDPALRPGAQVLVFASGEVYIRSFTGILERLVTDQGRKGILISTQWSANALMRKISLSKMPRNSLKVIDTVSLSLGSGLTSMEEFIFLTTPASLESILAEVERGLRSEGSEYNFLVIDSITHLKRHHTDGELCEFFHLLLNRLLEEQFLVMLFEQEKLEDDNVSRMISSMIDQTFELAPGGGGK